MPKRWLIAACIGALIPLSFIAPWFLEHGLDLPRFIQGMFQTRISGFLSLDLILSATALCALSIKSHRAGVAHMWAVPLGTVLIGVSFGLPLWIYLTQHPARQG